MVLFPPDTLILTDLGSNLERIGKLLAQLDVAPSDQLRVIQVKFASVQDVADKIQRILDKSAGGGSKPPLPGGVSQLVVADERTNKLVVRSSPATLDRVLQLLTELDVPLSGDGQLSVYPLKNADAKEVVATLEPLLQSGRGKQPNAPNVVQGASLFTGEVKVSASEATNGVVVMASPGDYRTLARLIEQLDAPRRQIFIEAAILEIDIERDSDLGLSFHDVQNIGSMPVLFGTNYPGQPNTLATSSLLSASGALAAVEGPVLSEVVQSARIQHHAVRRHPPRLAAELGCERHLHSSSLGDGQQGGGDPRRSEGAVPDRLLTLVAAAGTELRSQPDDQQPFAVVRADYPGQRRAEAHWQAARG